jgi:hypothetical protein
MGAGRRLELGSAPPTLHRMRAGETPQRPHRGNHLAERTTWRRRAASGLAGCLVAAATLSSCGNGASTSTTTSLVPANFPTAAVRVWLEAVDAGDLTEIDRVVDRRTTAVVVALENGFDAEQLAAAATGGLGDDLASQYWRSFRDSFEDFHPGGLQSIEVGEFEEAESDGADFAFVDITGTEGATRVVTRLASNGQWQVDLVGTLAEALGLQFAALPDLDGSDEAREVLYDVISGSVLPPLDLVASQPGSAIEVEEAADSLRAAVGPGA